jgi:hypothetical protein
VLDLFWRARGVLSFPRRQSAAIRAHLARSPCSRSSGSAGMLENCLMEQNVRLLWVYFYVKRKFKLDSASDGRTQYVEVILRWYFEKNLNWPKGMRPF